VERVTVIIPAYNEEGAIASVLDAVHALPLDTDVIVIDDASTDRTGEIARSHHDVRVLHHPLNRGYGRSVKDALSHAETDIIIVTDADGTYPIEKIPELLEKFQEGFDMVVGARHGSAYRGNFLKMPARIVFKAMVEFITGRHIPDINSGLRVFHKSTVQKYLPDICDGFSFLTTITLVYLLTGKTVTYVPIAYHSRIGHSKVRIIRDTLRTLQYITEVAAIYNPLKLFLLLCVLLIALAGACLLHSIITASAVTFLSAVIFAATSCMVFALGLIAVSFRRTRP
jgi:polyisoprenyl-phosphate glycosyltransferase